MQLTTHTARRYPTVVGHWAIFGLPTLAQFLFCFVWLFCMQTARAPNMPPISGTDKGERSLDAIKTKCARAPMRSRSKEVSLQNATSLAQPVAALADTSGQAIGELFAQAAAYGH